MPLAPPLDSQSGVTDCAVCCKPWVCPPCAGQTCAPGYFGPTCAQLCTPSAAGTSGSCTGAYTFNATTNATTGCASGSTPSASPFVTNVSNCTVTPVYPASAFVCGYGFLVSVLGACGAGPSASCCAALDASAGAMKASASANCFCDVGTYQFINGYAGNTTAALLQACATYFNVSDVYSITVNKAQCPAPPASAFTNTTACPVVTPSPAPATSSFRVAVITDNHLVDDCYPCANDLLMNYGNQGSALDYFSLYYAEQRLNLTITQILASNPLPDFVIMSGDMVHNPDQAVRKYASLNGGVFNITGFMNTPAANSAYMKAARAFSRFGIPVYATPGNHDSCVTGTSNVANRATCAAVLKAYFPTSFANTSTLNANDPNPSTAMYYSFNWKGWKFMSADSTAGPSWNLTAATPGGNGLASYGASQLTWMDAQLSQGLPTVMWTHYPRSFALANEAPGLAKPDLTSVLTGRCNLMASLTGHIHMYTNWSSNLGFPEYSMSATRYDEGAWLMLQMNANPASVSAASLTVLDGGKISTQSLGTNSHTGVWSYGSSVTCVANCSSLVTTNVSFTTAGWPGTAAPPPPPLSTASLTPLAVVLTGLTTTTFNATVYPTFATVMANALSVAGGVGNLLQSSYINVTAVTAVGSTAVVVSFTVTTFQTAATTTQLAGLITGQQAALVANFVSAGMTGVTAVSYPSPPPPSPPPVVMPPPPSPPVSTTTVAISGAASLVGYSVATFGTAQATAFKSALATATGVTASSVYITSVSNTAGSGRHLAQTGVTVAYTVLLPVTASVSTATAALTSITAANLQTAGLTACTSVAVATAPAQVFLAAGAPPPSDVASSLPPTSPTAAPTTSGVAALAPAAAAAAAAIAMALL